MLSEDSLDFFPIFFNAPVALENTFLKLYLGSRWTVKGGLPTLTQENKTHEKINKKNELKFILITFLSLNNKI